MDIKYKTFATRSNQEIRFDQMLRSHSRSNSSYSKAPNKSTSPASPRKKVNVVSFTPEGEGQELVTKPTEVPEDSDEGQAISATQFDNEISSSRLTAAQLLPPSLRNINLKNHDYGRLSSGAKSIQNNMKKCTVSADGSLPSVKASSNDENDSAQLTSNRSFFYRKTKRVAYDPRSVQNETHQDGASPPKSTKIQSSTNSQQSTRRPVIGGKPVSIANNPIPSSKPSGTKPAPSDYDFPDSDEEEAKDDLRGGVLPTLRNRPPRATADRAPSITTQTSNPSKSTMSINKSEIVKSNHSPTACNDDENASSDEEDDVRPWFCPASRGVLSKPVSQAASVKVSQSKKSLYTVVRKVNDPHVSHDRGAHQQLLDDLNYIIDGLSSKNPMNTRCLSVLQLANKCITASFRHAVHSYGAFSRICSCLSDAHTDYGLALTTAGLFYLLSRDRNPNIFDCDSLDVLLKLFSAPTAPVSNGSLGLSVARPDSGADLRARLLKVFEALQKSINGNGNTNNPDPPASTNSSSNLAKLLPSIARTSALSANLTGLNTRHLCFSRPLTTFDLLIEVLINLGSLKAADWFKATLRSSGGLDRVADAAVGAIDYLADLAPPDEDHQDPYSNLLHSSSNQPTTATNRWSASSSSSSLDSFALDKLKRVGYYTKLFENMTYMNSDNQTYLVKHKDRELIDQLVRCLRLCSLRLPTLPTTAKTTDPGQKSTPRNDSAILVDCVLGIFRFLVNVSQHEIACDRLGGSPGLLEISIDCLFNLPDRMPVDKRFDLLVLSLCLLVNLCEHCPENRSRIVYLELTPSKRDSSSDADDSIKMDVDSDEKEKKPINALDELVQLFLSREERARNHDFERDDDEEAAERNRRREEEQMQAAQSATESSLLPSTRGDPPTHIEEAGLKWRLIEDRKQNLFPADSNPFGRKRRSKRGSKKQRRRHRDEGLDEELDDDGQCSDGDEGMEEDEEGMDDDSSEEDEETDQEDDDDESVCSGADVEFVTDTKEERKKLAEHMTQAQQHMEDSVVAAYAALLIGCIIQSSTRYTERIRAMLPDGQFRPLAIMLAKLLSFLSLTKGVGSSGSESILRIVRILEAQDSKPTTAV